METGILQVDPRHTMRRIKTAIQGNVIRAIVELITNGDDSYRRMEDEQKSVDEKIEILYQKDSYSGLFAIRDYAAGMSIDDVRGGLTKYGAATSGMQEGKSARGYFGQGAKDALASMIDGRICTFKNNEFVEYRIFTKNRTVRWEIDSPVCATSKIRQLHKIDGNGTVAYFKVDPDVVGRVPRFDTLCKDLANNYLLRKIMTNPHRKVFLCDEKGKQKRRLRYQMPQGQEILSEDFVIPYGDYGDFPIHMSMWRAENELTQTGDDREGGLLLLDDEDAVLGISLFKYDAEPLASRFFGEVLINGFRKLLIEEEPVLREERDGLVARHPFNQALISEVERRIESKIKDERLRKQRELESKVDREEEHRYKKAFNILNEIAEIEVQSITNLGPDLTDEITAPPNGFCLYPLSAQITVGKKYAFELRLDTNIIPHGTSIKIVSTHPKILILTPEVKPLPQEGHGILRKYITVEGTEPNIEGIIRATAGNSSSEAKIFVVPEEKGLLFEEGMEFEPGSLTLHPNQTRKAYLLVYVKIVEGGSTIKISSDNPSVHISKEEIKVNEADAIRHVVKYELEIWGEGIGQNATLTAEADSRIALLEVRIRSQKGPPPPGRKGMFNEPEFVFDLEPLQRTSYSIETGKIRIYVNFPSIKFYLGEDCRYRKTLASQVLIADLLAERSFLEMARRISTSRVGVTLSPEAVPDRIQRDAQEFSRKYGKKVHEDLVDQALIDEARSTIK